MEYSIKSGVKKMKENNVERGKFVLGLKNEPLKFIS